MKKFSLFFTALLRSVTDPRYFSDVVKARSIFSLFFFPALTLLTSLIGIVKFRQTLMDLNLFSYPQELVSAIPPELIMTFTPQGLSINQSLPYTIPLPVSWQSSSAGSTAEVSSLVVFASQSANLSASSMASISALAIVTPTDVYLPERDENLNPTGTMRVYAIPGVQEARTVTRSDLERTLTSWTEHPLIKGQWWVWIMSGIVVAVWWPLVWLYRLVAVMLLATGFWVVARFVPRWRSLSWGSIFKVALVFYTLPLLLIYVAEWLQLAQFTLGIFWLVGLGWLALGAHIHTAVTSTIPVVPSKTRTPTVRKSRKPRRLSHK